MRQLGFQTPCESCQCSDCSQRYVYVSIHVSCLVLVLATFWQLSLNVDLTWCRRAGQRQYWQSAHFELDLMIRTAQSNTLPGAWWIGRSKSIDCKIKISQMQNLYQVASFVWHLTSHTVKQTVVSSFRKQLYLVTSQTDPCQWDFIVFGSSW